MTRTHHGVLDMLWLLAAVVLAAWMIEIFRLTSIEYDWEYNQDHAETPSARNRAGCRMTSTEGAQGDEPVDGKSDDDGVAGADSVGRLGR